MLSEEGRLGQDPTFTCSSEQLEFGTFWQFNTWPSDVLITFSLCSVASEKIVV